MDWAYGITVVDTVLDDQGKRITVERTKHLFPRTLKSLAKAGFDKPRLFIDGAKEGRDYEHLGLEITTHYPNLRTAGNWVLSLYELYIRNPEAKRYAIFQDDFVTGLNLRQYLDCCNYPDKGYWNLYTFPVNQNLCPEKKTYQGWYPSDQFGKGAVALVFNREAVCTLLSQRSLVNRPQDAKRGHKAIDGGIIDAFKDIGWLEYTHNPSLVQHTGLMSSMGNPRHPTADSFQGEDFDFMTLVPNREIIDAKLKEWETEKASLEKAMREDQERLDQARTPADRAKFQAHVQRYQKRLKLHLNDYSKRLTK